MKDNVTLAATVRALGLAVGGYNGKYVKKHIARLDLDTSHFVGRKAGKSKNSTSFKSIVTIDDLINGTAGYKNKSCLKDRLLKEELLYYECYVCGLDEWQDAPLTLQLDHIDGVSSNDKLDNLRLLCPNCHSQTKTFCGRNSTGKRLTRICKAKDCSTKIHAHRAHCDSCDSSYKKEDYYD